MTFSLSLVFLRERGWTVPAEFRAHRRSGQRRAVLLVIGHWFLETFFFPWLLVSLTSQTISRQLVLIPEGLGDVLFSNKQTFHLTMALSTSIFQAVKATQASTFRDFHLCANRHRFFPQARYVVVTDIENKGIWSLSDWLKFCAPANNQVKRMESESEGPRS